MLFKTPREMVQQAHTDGTLATLVERQTRILILRFGLDDDGKMHQLEEVAEIMGLPSKERARQIEDKALRRLRFHYSNPEKLAERERLLQVADSARSAEEIELLVSRVDEVDIELSIRTRNSLEHGAIVYVYQLVQMSEKQILSTKNIGRRCLREIKEGLGHIGLSLGMTLSEQFIQKLEEKTRLSTT